MIDSAAHRSGSAAGTVGSACQLGVETEEELVSFVSQVPSAFITYSCRFATGTVRSRELTKAIRRPSGDQDGAKPA